MKSINETKVKGCYHECPLFGVGPDGMECTHPAFQNDPDPYSNMIINHQNSMNGMIPDECPLRSGKFERTVIIELEN